MPCGIRDKRLGWFGKNEFMLKQLDIYKGKKVFVTGHTGFKGAWLVKILHKLGAEIKGYSLPPNTEPNLYTELAIDKLCESVFGDIMDSEKLTSEINSFAPDFLFHLAAQPLVRLSYEKPSETFMVNAVGTANVLDGIRGLNKPCIAVMITTDKVYHNNEWHHPYRETDRLGGYDPYSASKACAELVIDSYRNSFFNVKEYNQHKKAIIVARAGNVIGGGDWAADRLIPDIAKALMADKKVVLRNPLAVRPWQHVIEPLFAYLLVAQKATTDYISMSKAFNFGPNADDTLTVEQMTKLAVQIWQKGGYEIITSETQVHEANLLKLDISLATAELKWKPKLDATTALVWSLEWYKNFYEQKESVMIITENQIDNYLNKSINN